MGIEKEHIEVLQKVVIIAMFLAMAYWIFMNASFVHELVKGYGLVGLLLASIIANASIFFPMPIDVIVLAVGADTQFLLEALLIGLIAGIGAAIGEMTAYIMGLLGVQAAEKTKNKEFEKIQKIKEQLGKKGMLFVFIGALTPLPFDIIGIAAGLVKYDPKKFFMAALAGKIVRYILIALSGFSGIAVFNFLTG